MASELEAQRQDYKALLTALVALGDECIGDLACTMMRVNERLMTTSEKASSLLESPDRVIVPDVTREHLAVVST